MAELQTVAAIFDLLKVSYEAGKFLKKVKDADTIALEIIERISRLESVLQGIQAVLRYRDDDAPPDDGTQVANRIRESVSSCTIEIVALRSKVGGFDVSEPMGVGRSLLERVKVALRSPSIGRCNAELEARIHILSTDLTVLQLFDQTKTSTAIETNHDELLQAISTLGAQVSDGNRLLKDLTSAYIELERRTSEAAPSESATSASDEAIRTLDQCMKVASDLHERFSERFTSEHLFDNHSIRQRREIEENVSPMGAGTPSLGIYTPSTRHATLPSGGPPSPPEPAHSDGDDMDDDELVWPLEILNRHISGYVDKARKEHEAGHFHRAGFNLSNAIQGSETRELRYGVPFTGRAQLQEEMALLLLKEKRYAEAVQTVHQLLRDRRSSSMVSTESDPIEQVELVQARQHQLLALIYYERHVSSNVASLSYTTGDLEQAENHARRAFTKRWKVFGVGNTSGEEADQYNAGIQLLVRILETRDKTVEANELNNFLLEGSESSGSIRRVSTLTSPMPQMDYETIDKHDILVEAILAGDSEQIQSLLAVKDLNIERLDRHGKTFLMHAVESKDESIVHKLLDPEVAANVDTANKKGLTALHVAAVKSLHDMAVCLLHHDADLHLKDAKGETPAMKAVQLSDVRMVEIFFNKDEATLTGKGGDEWSVLHYAVRKANRDMVNLLLELTPQLREAIDQAGKTALHLCVEDEKLDLVAALLEHKHALDVNTPDSVGRNPLYLAAQKPATPLRESIVRLLVEKGAQVDSRKPPPRMRDYMALNKAVPRRDSTLSRTSISTDGTFDTTSTKTSRFSRMVGRMGRS